MWDGLKPMTRRLSTLLSLRRKSREESHETESVKRYVAVLVCFPLRDFAEEAICQLVF